ncbi:MAG TPA: alpha/beta fold hydrolase [Candidatus Angelobacter sp.]|jgi:pimeloyl-ACP methyl ester carboxylesterase|nr:alpha/beta fold hydrolase [Candidatus Angelobacter sp.]
MAGKTPSPATIEEGWVTLPTGSRMHYRRAGEGEPILLLHGIAHSCKAWDRVVVPLAERYDVVALDMLGCGLSDKPDTDYSLGSQAVAVRFVLDELGLDVVTAVGHSLGGGVAMTLAYHYPERVGRLGLVSSGGLGKELHPLFRMATLPWAPEYVIRGAFHPLLRAPRNALTKLITGAAGDPFFHNPEGHRAEMEELLETMEQPAAQRAFLAMLRSASSIAGQAVSALDRLGLAGFPILIVWGREDHVFPVQHAYRAAEVVPEAQVVVIDECGHFPQVEATSTFTHELLDWLARTESHPVDPRAMAGRPGVATPA